MSDLKLVIFDVDGTLVDSQTDIVASMRAAFEAIGVAAPSRADMLSIVGLSLPLAVSQLVPGLAASDRDRMVDAYKTSYRGLRIAKGTPQSSPLYPHVRAVLDELHAIPQVLLGIATGKSRRGLDKLLDGHRLRPLFVTHQCADDHPSKPHPAMLLAALGEAGIEADNAVMLGDTSFDMDMAQAAGIRGIGVSWGYHPTGRLAAASSIIDDIRALPALLRDHWRLTA
ncbi:HAD family hydrolase [Salipiger aestuarii]|uniref:Phosphoglycolate phosphatase n=1 Tax=Salipiger aestuarii TaxID=568098 RepID=A0A327XYM6_9RHOB|nr:HAD-IA family hydrolase [Salipiger aestuarii]EIE49420.1 hydrolase, putative [Citreicella sp. 357]KAA8606462.1 HAD family hydrolase [Salipiger aestuarii]KAA8609625.1 HAD family hydrolase [Salipiger aestuarii]KAB2541047.1 HAD family hydrolase [Salipiger aestuarii]RAK13251.1 phosphoglycolate phosphatase [Salipiger aestuarii]